MHISYGRSAPSHATASQVPTATEQMRERVVASIAAAFLDGEWTPNPMAARAAYDLGLLLTDGMEELAAFAVVAFPVRPGDAPRQLRASLERSAPFHRLYDPGPDDQTIDWSTVRPRRAIVPTEMGTRRWPVEQLDTMADLREMLGLVATSLSWFADARSLERSATDEALRHYHYRWIPKASGGLRLLEAPKGTLKFFQRRILAGILDCIPQHPASHGFRRERSVHSFVESHVGRAVVIRIDLENFFASVSPGAVFGILRSAGYPEPVAHCLTGLATNAVPEAVLQSVALPAPEQRSAHRRMLSAIRHPHLPQGAATSPAFANLAAYGLDCRLTGLAAAFGADYTRYADDLAFSGEGELQRRSGKFISLVSDIVGDEGFSVNRHKTRIAEQSRRQILTGLVVNARPNVPRTAFDRLKAILHDAAIHGPDHANRDGHTDFRAHLIGSISWVEASNPHRGTQLRAMLDTIDW